MSIGIRAVITPSPIGLSVGEMKRQAASFVGLNDHPEALNEAQNGINRGIRQLNTRVWNFSRKFHTINLIKDVADYPLVQDWKRTWMGMYLNEESQDDSRCKYIAPDEFYYTIRETDGLRQTQGRGGLPRRFTVRNYLAEMLFTLEFPFPENRIAQNPFFKHWYFAQIQIAVSDSQVLNLPSQADNYLISMGEYYLARKHEPPKAKLAKADADEAFTNLLRDDDAMHNEDYQQPPIFHSFHGSGSTA